MTLVGIGLTSASGILLEVALTRLYSVVLFYHFVFAVVSIAVAGLAAGAILSQWLRLADGAWPAYCRTQSHLAAAGGLSVVLVLAGATWVTPGNTWGTYAAYFVPAALPFVLFGMILSTWFCRLPGKCHLLYFADLAGGGLAAVAVRPILDCLGGINAVLFIALVGALAGVVFSLGASVPRTQIVAGAVALSLLLILLGNVFRPTLDLQMTARPHATKTLYADLAGNPAARIIHTGWDSVGRVDVVERPGWPVRWLYVDGGSWSRMVRFPVDAEETRRLQADIAFFPFLWKVPGSMLLIGPGGGIDVVFGLMAGVREMTAVELSPSVVRAVRGMADYNGGIYDRPDVALVIDNGRSFLLRSARQYDLIYLSQAVTEYAELLGYSFAESALYTREAFREYLDHLSEEGRVAFVFHNVFNLTKAFLTALDALRADGKSVGEAAAHLLVVNAVDSETPMTPLLIMSRRPIGEVEERTILALAGKQGFRPLFTPRMAGGDMARLVAGGEAGIRQFLGAIEYRLEPATDDSPFFHQFYKGIPPHLLFVLGGIGLVWAAIVAWIMLSTQDGLMARQRIGQTALFTLLGLGFMFVEIPLIQRVGLLVGNPTSAVALVFFALLVPGGFGSLLAGRGLASVDDPTRRLARICGMAGVMIVVLVWLWPWMFAHAGALGGWYRLLLPGAPIGVLGLLLGIPFPACLTRIGIALPSRVPQLWAVNAIMSVAGSVLALTGTILYGGMVVMLAAAGLYLIVGGLLVVLGRPTSQSPSSSGDRVATHPG